MHQILLLAASALCQTLKIAQLSAKGNTIDSFTRTYPQPFVGISAVPGGSLKFIAKLGNEYQACFLVVGEVTFAMTFSKEKYNLEMVRAI